MHLANTRGVDDRRIRVRLPTEVFIFSSIQTDSVAWRASCLLHIRGSFRGGKVAGVTNAWSCTSTPSYDFRPRCLIKHGNNFTFTPMSILFRWPQNNCVDRLVIWICCINCWGYRVGICWDCEWWVEYNAGAARYQNVLWACKFLVVRFVIS
jgi:hypothetical protein